MKTPSTLVIGLALLGALGCLENSPSTPAKPQPTSTSQQSQVKRIQLLEFHAEWCGPCKQQKPIVDALKLEFPKVDFKIVDVDNDREQLAAKFQVNAIPRLIILVDGRVFEDFEGLQSRADLRAALTAALKRAAP